jgi:glyoxylase-like metal-dependent hydrolase (beta-lactamase superfamily II)
MLRSKLAKVLAGLVVLGVAAVGALWALLAFTVAPLDDGARLADGAITAVITDCIGPIPIAAYVFDLADGGVGLVDAGLDPEAEAIRSVLARRNLSAVDVRAIFFTHLHDDHRAGARAFLGAEIYVPHTAAERVRALRAGVAGIGATHGFRDGDTVIVHGTTVELFAIPGHTPDSTAILIDDVLFLGDSAAGLRNGTLAPNSLLTENAEQNERSLAMLAERLRPRQSDVRQIAFGHQGPLEGLSALLTWAAQRR